MIGGTNKNKQVTLGELSYNKVFIISAMKLLLRFPAIRQNTAQQYKKFPNFKSFVIIDLDVWSYFKFFFF